MTNIVGERALIATKDVDALRTRFESIGVRFEFIPREDVTEIRYEATTAARQYVDQYRLPGHIEVHRKGGVE